MSANLKKNKKYKNLKKNKKRCFYADEDAYLFLILKIIQLN